MFKGKRIASGISKDELINGFRQKMWDKWCMEPTKKGSAIKYKPYPMPDIYIPFSIWELWIAIGPPAGEACNAILKVEFIAPPPASMVLANGANPEEVPAAISALNAGVQSGRFVSRQALTNQPQSVGKQQFTSPTYSFQAERLDRSKQNDRRKELEWLSKSEFSSDAEKSGYRRQLHDLMVASCAHVSPMTPIMMSSGTESEGKSESIATASTAGLAGSFRKASLEMSNIAAKSHDIQCATMLLPVSSSAVPNTTQTLGTIIHQGIAAPIAPVLFEQFMDFVDYKKWLLSAHGLVAMCVPSDGACLFESILHCIKKLVSCSGGASYAPMPVFAHLIQEWSLVTASSFRKHILTMMNSFLEASFPALENLYYTSIQDLIDSEMEGYGIENHDTLGSPHAILTTEDYFKLMSSDSAYGTLSVLLSITVFCNIQIHVWFPDVDLPVVYGSKNSTHYISLVKESKYSDTSYDALIWSDPVTHVYETSKRCKEVEEERERRKRAAALAKDLRDPEGRERAATADRLKRRDDLKAWEASVLSRQEPATTDTVASYLVDDVDEAQFKHLKALTPLGSTGIDAVDLSNKSVLSKESLSPNSQILIVNDQSTASLASATPVTESRPQTLKEADHLLAASGWGRCLTMENNFQNPNLEHDDYLVQFVDRDGDCLFHCFVAILVERKIVKFQHEDPKKNISEMRHIIADFFTRNKNIVTCSVCDMKVSFQCDNIQSIREGVGGRSTYGGIDEIVAFGVLYNLAMTVFSPENQQPVTYNTHNCDSQFPEEVLLNTLGWSDSNRHAGCDHWQRCCKKSGVQSSPVPVDNRDFSRYHDLSARILTWKTEYDVCMFSEKEGRGLLNYVAIDDGNPVHRYGGDRVFYNIGQGPKSFVYKGDHNPQKQRNGEVKFRPAQVARLFAKYPQLDRSKNDNISFHPTHAVQLGTHHPKHWKVTVCATAFMLIIDYLFRFRIGSLSTAFRCVTLASTMSPMSTGWDWLRPIVRKTSTWCVNG
jgi:hypothetical protein